MMLICFKKYLIVYWTFLTPWYARAGVRIKIKKCSFFWKFGALCFLLTPILRFILLPYCRGYWNNCCPSGCPYSPVRMRNINSKKTLNFPKVTTFLEFMYWFPQVFWKINTKNYNSHPCFFNLVKLRTISQAAHFLK